jgi:hypothetical protein
LFPDLLKKDSEQIGKDPVKRCGFGSLPVEKKKSSRFGQEVRLPEFRFMYALSFAGF